MNRTISDLQSSCGQTITVSQRAAGHLEAHPDVLEVLAEAASNARMPAARHAEIEVDLGRVVGDQRCVETTRIGLDTPAFFISRKRRAGATRTLTAGAPAPSRHVTIIADRDDQGSGQWRLVTAWIGRLAQPEPWDPRLTTPVAAYSAMEFWSTHALLVDPSEASGPVFKSTFRTVIERAQRELRDQRR